MTFASLGLPEPVTRGVRAAGYTTPTPIQSGAIPLILPVIARLECQTRPLIDMCARWPRFAKCFRAGMDGR